MLQGEHSAILSTFIKLLFVIKIFVLSIYEWPLKTGFTVFYSILDNGCAAMKSNCSQLCLPKSENLAQCKCTAGYMLNADSKSCDGKFQRSRSQCQ